MTVEKFVQTCLHQSLGGLIEVKTPVGRIDILTESHVYEIKEYKKYKEAIGQLVSYGVYYPDKIKALVLFNSDPKFTLSLSSVSDEITNLCILNSIELHIFSGILNSVNLQEYQSKSYKKKVLFLDHPVLLNPKTNTLSLANSVYTNNDDVYLNPTSFVKYIFSKYDIDKRLSYNFIDDLVLLDNKVLNLRDLLIELYDKYDLAVIDKDWFMKTIKQLSKI